MRQKMSGEPFEDEIDVRDLVNTLLRNKWLIIGFTILVTLAAFLIAKFLLPKQYQASAQVIITKPIFTTALDTRIQSSAQVPDAKSLKDLTKVDDLLQNVYQSPELAGFLDEGVTLRSLASQMTASLIGTNQLRLDVTDTDPKSAAQIANVWAGEVAGRLNNLFDINETSLGQIEQQKEVACQNWESAEQELLDYLPEGRVEVSEVNLEQAQETLTAYLEKLKTLDLLVSDAQVFEGRLRTQDRNSSLAVEDALSLITLQQRGAGGPEALQIQVTGQDILGEGYTVAEALEGLGALSTSLQTQRGQLQATLEGLEKKISQMATDLESAKYRLGQLTVERDLAQNAYQALSGQEAEVRIALAQNDQLAKVAGRAIPPEEPKGPRSLIVAALAGVLAFVLVCAAVLIGAWWKSPAQEEIKRNNVA